MQPIGRDQIVERIRAENPWWVPPHRIPPDWEPLEPRPYLERVWPLLAEGPHRALVLLGPRRVGKTVLLHHAIQRLLREGAAPTGVGYVSLDSPAYTDLSLESLVRLVADAAGRSEPPQLLVFDEVQYHRDWERHLKVLVDAYRTTRFVASGSAAAALRLKSIESGAGRFTDFLLPPLTFCEFVMMTGQQEVALAVFGEPTLEGPIARLNDLFVEHVNSGGYPEAVFDAAVRRNPSRFIRQDVVDRVLLRDLPSLYGISNIQELNRLFALLAWNTGRELSLDSLSKGSGVSKNTIRRYIEYLQAAFLVDVLRRVDRDARHFKRDMTFKVHLTNPSMRAALFAPEPSSGDAFGALAETAVFAQLPPEAKARTSYARWSRGEEVDFVSLHPDGGVAAALEVKWSDRFVDEPEKLTGVLALARRHRSLRTATVTTRTRSGIREVQDLRIRFVPTAEYAFITGLAWMGGELVPRLLHEEGGRRSIARQLLVTMLER